VQQVGTIRLKELSIQNNPIQINPSKAIRDWLTLAARELLSMSPVQSLVFLLYNFFSNS
jgi:hypothetical protein